MHDWDDAFNNMGHVAGSQALPGLWSGEAEAYRQTVPIETDIAYGEGERHVFDLVSPDGPSQGLMVFVHGGFWMRLSKDFWTQFAEGMRARGWSVAMPSYTLTPNARLG
ncbi:MAG: alpha/beta hydrolase, partial [Devosiaceae bacterium]|nr:alpha/beta hydrolase [Devosiaceae bacterium MH13]